MGRDKPQFFDDVRTAALDRWNQIEGDPELGSAWRLLFRQVQNPRHVLSELLQNADDAGATEASVIIENGFFTLRHNGHDFREEEFKSLCRFGYSNKRGLLTIGFRGIGFKSVFSLGPIAVVVTPTLTFWFRRERFTQPEWIDIPETSEDTVIGVQLESPEKEQAIRTQIEAWAKSPVPLLFFQKIRTLRLFDRIIRVEDDGTGPSDRSRRVKLSGMEGGGILFRSKAEPFPAVCLDEVRSERFEPELDLPPCEVIILLSPLQQQRLYCVLPTDVSVPLPFSCQAPFVQDPARTGIMEPSMSPTNAWLLDRIGKLAAESMITWLRCQDLNLPDRARAYDLLPEVIPLNAATVSGAAAQRIIDAFRQGIEHEKLLLCSGGNLDSQSYTARLPRTVADAWGPDTARSLFNPGKRSTIAREVSAGARKRLHDWKFLDPSSFEAVFKALADETQPLPPRPVRMETLAAFWAFANENQPDPWGLSGWWRKAAIIPLAGRNYLGRANATLPSRSRPTECPLADWQFITERAEVLDDDWRKLIDWIKENPTEAQRSLEENLDRRLKDKELAGIVDAFRKTKLDQTPGLDQVFEQIAPRIFMRSPPEVADAIRYVQIAAKLDVSFPMSTPVKFLCVDGQWRGRSAGLLALSDIDLQYLLPEPWLHRHLISPEYEAAMQPSEIGVWRKWAVRPQKGGLSAFALPVALPETHIWNLDATAAFFHARGGTVPTRRWVSVRSEGTDFNWDRTILDHWNRMEGSEGAPVWLDVASAVTSAWSTDWEALSCYQVHQERNNSRVRIDDKSSAAAWLHDLRNRACVPDTYGVPRLPAELLRRTPETTALLDIEPFVLDRWDKAEHQLALDRLGVRTQATDASKILDRLRALSCVENPPIGPLRDLYRTIQRVLPRLPVDRVKDVVAAFANEALIHTEGSWERSAFCFRTNPSAIPGVSVLHSDIRDVIGLWDALKIPPQPSPTDALRWFESLPLDAVLADGARSAARKILGLYPQDMWNGQGRWLSLYGRIVRTAEFRWGCLDPRAVPGMLTSVRRETADFSMLDGSRLQTLIAGPPRLLETSVERRILGFLPGPGDAATEELWLHTLGEILSLLNYRDESEVAIETDRRSAKRMVCTRWIPTQSVRIQPYLDGVPAGDQSELSIAWMSESLYVQGDSVRTYKSLMKEISRPFMTSAALDTIRDCVGREAKWIRATLYEHLELMDSVPASIPVEQDATAQPETATGSVFPKQDENLQGQPAELPTKQPKSEPKIDSGRTTSEPKPDDEEKQSAPKQPSTLDRLAIFLASKGFHWDERSGRFLHPDGSLVCHGDGLFAWELSTADRVNPLWLAPASLSDPKGIEIPAEVWISAKRCQAVLLAPEGDSFGEHHFSTLRAEVDAQTLELYSAVYRIRVPDDGDGADRPDPR